MQRYRDDTIRDKVTLCSVDDLAEKLAEGSRQADLVAVFQAMNGVFDATLVEACNVDNGEGWRALQAVAAEMD